MDIEIRHLRLVKTIVSEGSIANAIGKLHLTPSALSHQLREAELQIGAKIFHRINKKLVLTDVGEKILAAANVILGEMDRVDREVRQIIKGETGLIRISTECYTSYHWLPGVLRKFGDDFPAIEIKIVFEATHRPLEKLLQGEIDVAITSDPVVNNRIEYLQLFNDEMVAVVSPFHPWADKDHVVAEDFTTENLIVHSLPLETVTVHQRVLGPADVKPANLTVLPLTEASLEMVRANMGIIVMARWALKSYLADPRLRTVKVTPQGLIRTQYAALLANEDRPEFYEYFIKFLSEEIEL